MGNGASIKIWTDPWVPTSPSRKVVTERGGTLIDKVSDLIDPLTGQWDEVLIGIYFLLWMRSESSGYP